MAAAARSGGPAVRRLERQGRSIHQLAARSRTIAAHITKDLEQTQIGVAYPSVPIGDPDYYAALGAVNVLSGGMSSRLFTEIREKEGLCYSVWATYQTLKDRARVICYAGSRNERSQDTLDVLLRELRRLPEGVETEEVERVQAGLKSSLIMQQESTARPRAVAGVGLVLSRPRAQLRRDPGGHRRPDAREHRQAHAPLSARRLHHRHARAEATGLLNS